MSQETIAVNTDAMKAINAIVTVFMDVSSISKDAGTQLYDVLQNDVDRFAISGLNSDKTSAINHMGKLLVDLTASARLLGVTKDDVANIIEAYTDGLNTLYNNVYANGSGEEEEEAIPAFV